MYLGCVAMISIRPFIFDIDTHLKLCLNTLTRIVSKLSTHCRASLLGPVIHFYERFNNGKCQHESENPTDRAYVKTLISF